jgi:nucleoside-diphosphate-sugar epimerase
MIKNKNKKIIAVTGSDGFLGEKICSKLEKLGYEVLRYDLNNFDIRNKIELPKNIEIIYHLAAINKPYFSKEAPLETFKTNVLGTLNLLEAVKNSSVKKIIFTSSVFVYKNMQKTKESDIAEYNGIYPYGLEKLVCEEYIKIYSDLCGFDYAILRITGVYGPGMYKNPIYDFIQGFLKGKINIYVNKNSIYNFIYIDDVVSGLVKALKWKNQIINLCSDKNVKLTEIYNLLSKILKNKLEISDTKNIIKIKGNNKKIKKMGWKPAYSLERGLIKTYKFLKDNEKK